MFFAFLDWMYIFLHVIITEHALSVDLLTDKILYICIEKKIMENIVLIRIYIA